jgi:voltage-gated potassium channel
MPEQGEAKRPRLLARMVLRRRLTTRRAAVIIGGYTVSITLLGGALVRVLDHDDFHTFGAAVWWALQTVTTVGYGDIVPRSSFGRAIAGILMVSGIAFLAVVTASVTAALVEAARAQISARRPELTPELTKEIATRLAALEGRFDQLEAYLRSDRD